VCQAADGHSHDFEWIYNSSIKFGGLSVVREEVCGVTPEEMPGCQRARPHRHKETSQTPHFHPCNSNSLHQSENLTYLRRIDQILGNFHADTFVFMLNTLKPSPAQSRERLVADNTAVLNQI